jgi:hypothetical protein
VTLNQKYKGCSSDACVYVFICNCPLVCLETKVYPGAVTEALGVEICVETNFERLKLLNLFEEKLENAPNSR